MPFGHHLAVLAKWFRLNRRTRAAILLPAFAAFVFVLDIVLHTRPILPSVVIMPLVVILSAFLPDLRQEESDTGERENPRGE